ncbi:hypothetical protein [Janibacter sp. LM]|uniref:hypothetical protein n=1 Tax=Janibacter sp. LM TaxID=3144845 RepID=UPI0031F6F39B
MPKRITEASTLTVTESPTPGRISLQLIDAGWGSSGYYSPQVLENAANEQVFPAGTHIFFDHPSESERHDRPERSVRDLAAVLDEDATYADGALVAEAKVIGPYRDLITDPVFMESVGMSIRAAADTTVGEAEGRKGTIVTQLIEGVSVDLVTRAGRGGRILAAVESARRDLVEATTDEVRSALNAAAADHGDAYVHDHDPDTGVAYVSVYVEGQRSKVWAVPYTYDAPNAVIDWDDPTEVRPTTSYVPVVPDDSPATDTVGEGHQPPVIPAGSTQESKEDTMPQIEESRLAQLEADAGRATTAESERDAATARAQAAEARVAAFERREAIDRVVNSVEGHDTLNALERRGITADALQADELDEDALRTAVESAVADRAAAQGAGRITGFGATVIDTDTSKVVESADDAVAAAFGRTIKEA